MVAASLKQKRPARPGDFFRADEESVRAAHGYLLPKLASLEAAGYDYPTLLLSITNEWRMDNDPPLPTMSEFVETWNRLKLAPTLRLSTAGDALARLESQVGSRADEREGVRHDEPGSEPLHDAERDERRRIGREPARETHAAEDDEPRDDRAAGAQVLDDAEGVVEIALQSVAQVFHGFVNLGLHYNTPRVRVQL